MFNKIYQVEVEVVVSIVVATEVVGEQSLVITMGVEVDEVEKVVVVELVEDNVAIVVERQHRLPEKI